MQFQITGNVEVVLDLCILNRFPCQWETEELMHCEWPLGLKDLNKLGAIYGFQAEEVKAGYYVFGETDQLIMMLIANRLPFKHMDDGSLICSYPLKSLKTLGRTEGFEVVEEISYF